MNWREFLDAELHSTYSVTERLLVFVDDASLEWKPSEGSNWMTMGQLLKHLTIACGACFRGFIAGDWGLPEGADISEIPPAEKLPTIESVVEAKRMILEDKRVAFEMLAVCGDEELAHKAAPAPWDPTGMVLGQRLFQMVDHLKQHKGQLFYYLKLQGKPVSTANLWGM